MQPRWTAGISRREQPPLCCQLFLSAGIVRRIDVGDCKGTLTVNLHNRWAGYPSIMVHCRRCLAIPSCGQLNSLFLVKVVAHPDVKIAGDDRHVFRCRVIVGRDLVTRWHLQTNNVETVLAWIAREHRKLRAFWKERRRRSPLNVLAIHRHLHIVCQCATYAEDDESHERESR